MLVYPNVEALDCLLLRIDVNSPRPYAYTHIQAAELPDRTNWYRYKT